MLLSRILFSRESCCLPFLLFSRTGNLVSVFDQGEILLQSEL